MRDGLRFTIEIEQESDGRWIGAIPEIPGALAYGNTPTEALASVKALALRVLAEKLEHGEMPAGLSEVTFEAA
jgi:predicted RNase H-like HicB family nuclease